MSGLLLWPAGTVRADMPMHPLAVGQREGPQPDDVATPMSPTVGCTSSPSKKHTLVNAHPTDTDISRVTTGGRAILLTTKLCQTCSLGVQVVKLQEA